MSFALFLDVDGVLNTRTTVVGAPSGRTGIDESRVRLLKKALKQFGDAEIVLTSDWKLMREDGDWYARYGIPHLMFSASGQGQLLHCSFQEPLPILMLHKTSSISS